MMLIVDDDPKFLEDAAQLSPWHGILFARNAEQAWALIRSVERAFSVALIDLDLPDKDGFSLIREMHKHFPDLPLIAISGVSQKHVLESAKVFGAADTLQKPITSNWNIL